MHYPKGIAFDKNLLLVFPKLTEQRGSGSQGWGRLGATEIKALDLHPLSPWHQETGVTVFDNDAPEQVDDAYEIIAPEPVLTDAQISAKRNRQLREKGKPSESVYGDKVQGFDLSYTQAPPALRARSALLSEWEN